MISEKQIRAAEYAALHRINDALLLTATTQKNKGLLFGRIGAAIFLYHYDRFFQHDLSYQVACDMLINMSRNLESVDNQQYSAGIGGIGSALQYLNDEDFIEMGDAVSQIDKLLIRHINEKITPENLGCISFFVRRLKVADESHRLSATTGELDVLFLHNMIARYMNAAIDLITERIKVLKTNRDVTMLSALAGQLSMIQKVIGIAASCREMFPGIALVLEERFIEFGQMILGIMMDGKFNELETDDQRILFYALSELCQAAKLFLPADRVYLQISELTDKMKIYDVLTNSNEDRQVSVDVLLAALQAPNGNIRDIGMRHIGRVSARIADRDFPFDQINVGLTGLSGVGLSIMSSITEDYKWTSLVNFNQTYSHA
ncbi:hypothetical protein [Chitinophaga sp. RAB17]|uniref:hypothetical protein n=1 Tax=Chitinophaga sp. RAB17 TaxID=3233049 RepID=UPI003F92BFA3